MSDGACEKYGWDTLGFMIMCTGSWLAPNHPASLEPEM